MRCRQRNRTGLVNDEARRRTAPCESCVWRGLVVLAGDTGRLEWAAGRNLLVPIGENRTNCDRPRVKKPIATLDNRHCARQNAVRGNNLPLWGCIAQLVRAQP